MIAVLLLAGLFTWTAIAEPVRLTTFAVVGVAPVVFLAGLLQARLGRAGLAELLVDLGVNPGPAELQDAITRALRDPSVTLAYWLPEFTSFADVDGRQIAIETDSGRSATPITRDGARVAMILHDPWLDEEPQLLASVAAAAGLAIENAQLQVDLRARLADVRASRARIVSAGDAERKRLERDLHDGAQQRLVALSLALRRARSRLGETDENLAPSLDDASMLVKDALEELRTLARGIHPAVLTELGLAGALGALARRSPVPVTIEELPPDRLPQPVEATAYFVVSEALANVAKHAPEATVRVRATVEAGMLLVEVADDGPGGAAAAPGSGLQGLDDRVAAVGGQFEIANLAGDGTRIRASIPVDPDVLPAS
jgi:signal transduction histidine kinase